MIDEPIDEEELDKVLCTKIFDCGKRSMRDDAIVKPFHPLIRFNRNSINLVIGKRGSGKTFFIFKELLKLLQLDKSGNNFNYTAIYYISDKQSDDTVNMFKPLFNGRIGFVWVGTNKALHLIEDIEAFTSKLINPDYHIPSHIKQFYKTKYDQDADTVEFALQHLNAEHLPAGTIPNTVIIFDDCLGLFKKDNDLGRKCYQNRQMRTTIFMMLQDVQGISPSMKSNVNSLILFGGFSKQKWNTLMYQLPPVEGFTYEYDYADLTEKDCVLFDFETSQPAKQARIIRR